ncbi:MAG TPA: LmeA family phospholipid-binding protein [Candidatus Limnocylindrales bacterium]|nr:LmeA family phospholipid-binding protein [Candidatus Limnocylindrales bacterium]
MRGCLFVLVLGAALLVGIVWFGGPPIAGSVIAASLASSGFTAETLDVEVDADPPLTLAVGRADRVRITAGNVRWNGLVAQSMALELGHVDLIGRTAATVDGTFQGVALAGPGGAPVAAAIEIHGPASGAEASITVDGTAAATAARAAVEADFGIHPTSAELQAPNVIRILALGQTIDGHLELAPDGAIVAVGSFGTVRVIKPDPAIPIQLTGLTVADGRLVVTGIFDITALLR